MRILHVSQPVSAGVAGVVNDLTSSQGANGHDVHLASPPPQADQPLAGVGHWHAWPAQRSPGRSVLDETWRLASIVKRVDPEVVHLHSAKAGLVGRLAVRGRRPTVFQPHGWSFLAVDRTAGRGARTWERRAARWADAILCVSEAERRIGEAAGVRHRRYVVSPNAVHTERFGLRTREDARQILGLPAQAPLVLCVARLSRQKGIDLLLEAWGDVVAQCPDARLLIVGDGPEREDVERRASPFGDSVLLAGARDDVPTWYAAADVAVLSSRYEGMALTPLEGMASGLPVVGFAVSGLAESLGQPQEADVVVPLGDTAALAASVSRRLADPALREAEGARNLRWARAHHDAREAGRRIERLYRSLIGGAGS